MKEDRPYHHGNLQTELIEEGLALIHEEGKSNFSLRKLAKRLGVSPAACYNHYSTVDELMREMKNYVTQKFCGALIAGTNKDDPANAVLDMGIAYVNFFAVNPHYFTFLYDGDDYRIDLTEDTFDGDFEPFHLFKELGLLCLEYNHVEKDKRRDSLIIMWAAAHGLAAMANMKGFYYDGDWGALAGKLLQEKINLT
ncbi:TetR/AcrR family transcriptional regulator [Hungatella hathewayi]